MTSARSKKIINKLREFYGKTRPGLSYSGVYELAVSVVLSAQTTDKQVNSVTPSLFAGYPDFMSLSNARLGDVEAIIRSVGLYKTKAKNIIALSKAVVEKYNNILPDEFDELVKLPGVGRKSANVILSMGFHKPALAVDTHILRLANRIGYVNSRNPLEVERSLMRYIDKDYWIEAHLLIIKHGRTICMARNPLCLECPINRLCDFVNTPGNTS